ncbi:MAG: RNA methyltransferase [Clostridiales bacterium]|nr:RNA methyltransferase [Clostridiales bacterium]
MICKDIITSTANGNIKRLSNLLKKTKLRHEEGVYVIEGKKMFLEFLDNEPEMIETVYATKEFIEKLDEDRLNALKTTTCLEVDGKVFSQVAETVTPQGVMAVVRSREYSLDDFIRREKLRILMLDDLRDPGNLGTIIRTSEAAGIDLVMLSRESVDITGPKVVRSTMGAINRVPYIYADSLSEAIDKIRAARPDFKVFATALDSSVSYKKAEYGNCFAIVIGNEANGVSDEVLKKADTNIIIPMYGNVESLNASVAAAIVMFEAIER